MLGRCSSSAKKAALSARDRSNIRAIPRVFSEPPELAITTIGASAIIGFIGLALDPAILIGGGAGGAVVRCGWDMWVIGVDGHSHYEKA